MTDLPKVTTLKLRMAKASKFDIERCLDLLITSLRIQGSNPIATRIRSAHMKRYIPLEERQAKAIDILYDAVAEGSWRLKDLWGAELSREKMNGEVLGLQVIAADKLREARTVMQCLWETVGDGKQP